ncbi:hypothetical protein [Vulcanisaeta souniana]|uniref:hypothetical protein n=1 Tax=Vulcanisaeta souniana TaxID=164452 RepID=UPI001FB35439|nr:hypothetical protein [Vulcanisaeta souniana]
MSSRLTFHFGTDGVRGVIDEEFTEFLVAVLAESTIRYWSRSMDYAGYSLALMPGGSPRNSRK